MGRAAGAETPSPVAGDAVPSRPSLEGRLLCAERAMGRALADAEGAECGEGIGAAKLGCAAAI